MTLHDAAITRLSQWWQRGRRAGHSYAEGAALHGRAPERYRIRHLRRILSWGMLLPATALLGTLFFSPLCVLVLLLYPVQFIRLILSGTDSTAAVFLLLEKFPQTQGVLDYWIGRISGGRRELIEYK